MSGGQMLQQPFPLCGHRDQHASAIGRRVSALGQVGPNEPVDQLNRTVMLQQHLIGEILDHDRALGTDFDHQKGLVLLRRDPSRAGHGLAERQKPPQGKAKSGQPLVQARIKRQGFAAAHDQATHPRVESATGRGTGTTASASFRRGYKPDRLAVGPLLSSRIYVIA